MYSKSNEVKINYSDEEQAKVADILKKYQKGVEILNAPVRAYDERSIIEESERNQKAFNTYMPPRSSDPDFDWMADTVRPITRNKIIHIATAMTTMIIYPSFRAQNPNDVMDKETAEVMRLISRWVVEHSSYEMDYVRTVINALTDPVSYIETGFYEVMKKKKFKNADGKIDFEMVLDEIMSGIQYNSIKVNELLFGDVNITDIQKQPWLVKRKATNYENAKQKYGEHKHWSAVKKGKICAYDVASTSFYEEDTEWLKDEEVMVMTYYNRLENEEVTLVNGILMSDHEEPMTREDGLYPFAKMVFEEIQGMFTGKSAVNKIAPDQNLVDSLYNMIFDAGAIALIPPMVSYGETRFDSPVMIPGQVTHAGEEGKLEVLSGNSDIGAGLRLTQNIEQSMSESTQSGRSAGIADSKEMTAVEFSGLEENALRSLGLFGRQLSNIVKQLGKLMQGDILQYLTVPEIEQLLSGGQKLKYKTFLSNGNLQGGPSDMNSVRMTDQFLGKELVDEDEISMQIFEEEGVDNDTTIHLVNPVEFRKQKFSVFISEEELNKPNKRMEKALGLEAYDRAINNPTLDQNEITKEFLLKAYVPGDEDKFFRKDDGLQQPEVDQPVNGTLPQQITGGASLKTLLDNPQQ